MTSRTGITPNINAVKLTNFESRITPVPRRLDPPRVTTGWSASAEPPVPRFGPSAYWKTKQVPGLTKPTTPLSRYDSAFATTKYANGATPGSRFGSSLPVAALGQPPPVPRFNPEAEAPQRLVAYSEPPHLNSISNANDVPSFSPPPVERVLGPSRPEEFAGSPIGSIQSEADFEEGEVEDDTPFEKRSPNRWIYTKEHLLERTPSRAGGTPAQKELLYRQEAAGFIYAMGRELNL